MKTDSDYKIETNDIKESQLYLSDGIEEGLRNPRRMPDLDRDTFKLSLSTRSGRNIEIPIKAGWIKG